MKLSWRSDLAMWSLLAGMFVLAAVTWPNAPDRIPVHWNLHQQVDRYAGRFEGLFGLPLLALGLYLLLVFLPRIDPGRGNYPAFRNTFTVLRLTLVAFVAALYGVMHLWIRGIEANMNTVMPLLIGGLFIVVGNLFGKLPPNWFVGIRTPGTLSSEDTWVRAHRVGGWVYIAAGLSFMASAAVRTPWALWFAMAVLIAGTAGVVGYSYFVWRSDPDKIPPARTTPA